MSCKCQACGNRYKVDVAIPKEIWSVIKPEQKSEGAGLLCGRCIFDRIEKMGNYNAFNLIQL